MPKESGVDMTEQSEYIPVFQAKMTPEDSEFVMKSKIVLPVSTNCD